MPFCLFAHMCLGVHDSSTRCYRTKVNTATWCFSPVFTCVQYCISHAFQNAAIEKVAQSHRVGEKERLRSGNVKCFQLMGFSIVHVQYKMPLSNICNV